MIPETKLDHELQVGSYLVARGERNAFIVTDIDYHINKVILRSKHLSFVVSLQGLEADINSSWFSMPQATFCIWDTPTCTCGAAHTSFPNQHLRFCGEYK